jgi:hypothetical protein
LGGLARAGVGVCWWQGRASIEQSAPPPPPAAVPAPAPEALPMADPGAMTGPAPPEVSDLSREEQRFFRYDRNREGLIIRNEMLSTRTEAFRASDIHPVRTTA